MVEAGGGNLSRSARSSLQPKPEGGRSAFFLVLRSAAERPANQAARETSEEILSVQRVTGTFFDYYCQRKYNAVVLVHS